MASENHAVVSRSTSTPTVAKRTSPTSLLAAFPLEIFLEIFQWASSDSSRDLYALATSSKQLYGIFKANEFTVFNSSVMQIISLNSSRGEGPLAAYLTKLGLLCSITPRPIDPDKIQLALAQADDGPEPSGSNTNPFEYGRILAWIRHTSTRIRRRYDTRENFTSDHLQRSRYARNQCLAEPEVGDDEIQHPFDSITLPDILQVGAASPTERPTLWSVEFQEEMERYAGHAAVPVSARERKLARTINFVPCCTLERCPRFFSTQT